MTQYILALCPNEGNERFIPQTLGADIVHYDSPNEAHNEGEQALAKKTHRAYQIWTTGPVYVAQVSIVQREEPSASTSA